MHNLFFELISINVMEKKKEEKSDLFIEHNCRCQVTLCIISPTFPFRLQAQTQ